MSDPQTPNLNLWQPLVGGSPDPTWATELNQNFATIDAKCYSSGNLVPTSGLNINADLSLAGFNGTNVRSVRFNIQSGSLGGTNDKNQVYDVNGDLWWNSGAGTPVQITNGANVVTSGAIGSFPGKTISANYAVQPSDPNCLFVQSNVTAITLTLPGAATCAIGKTFFIFDIGGSAATNSITLAPNGSSMDSIIADGASSSGNVALRQNYGAWMVTTNANGLWCVIASQQDTVANPVQFSQGITLATTSSIVQQPMVYNFLQSGWTGDSSQGYRLIGGNSLTAQTIMLTQLRTGMTLASVDLWIGVTNVHTGGCPQTFPQIFIKRLPITAGTSPTSSDTIGNGGFVTGSFPTGNSWFNGGNLQKVNVTMTQNNVIDLSKYVYFAWIEDEQGTNSTPGNIYPSLGLNLSNINTYCLV